MFINFGVHVANAVIFDNESEIGHSSKKLIGIGTYVLVSHGFPELYELPGCSIARTRFLVTVLSLARFDDASTWLRGNRYISNGYRKEMGVSVSSSQYGRGIIRPPIWTHLIAVIVFVALTIYHDNEMSKFAISAVIGYASRPHSTK